MKGFLKKHADTLQVVVLVFLMALYLLVEKVEQLQLVDTTSQQLSWFSASSDMMLLLVAIAIAYLLRRLPSRLFLKQTLAVYSFYSISFYLLTAAEQANNVKFQLWNWEQSTIFSSDTMGIWLVVFFVSRLFKMRGKGNQEIPLQQIQPKQIRHLHIFLSLFIVPTILLHSGILDSTFQQLVEQGKVSVWLSILLWNAVAIGFFTLLIRIALDGFASFLHNQPSSSLVITFSLIVALVVNLLLQQGVALNTTLLDQYIFQGAVYYQVVFFWCFCLLVFAIVNRLLVGSFLVLFVSVSTILANSMKINMRDEPLLLTDMVWIGQLRTVLGFVDGRIISRTCQILFLVALLLWVSRKRIFPGKLFLDWRRRLAFICLPLFFFSVNYMVYAQPTESKAGMQVPILSKLISDVNVEWLGFRTNASYKSLAYVWSKQMTSQLMEKPAEYSSSKMAEVYERYVQMATEINQERSQSLVDQTVIYILSESFANPEYIPGTTVSYDPIPEIKRIKSETTGGLMQSDGYGGGTANMEFQTLTGLPYYNFSSSVSTLYTEVVPKLKYFPSISQHFSEENRIVIHPEDANNYRRKEIYTELDFGTLLFTKNGTEKHFASDRTQGLYLSDDAVYQTILEKIDTSQSQFFSVITMQNHTPWSEWNPEDLIATNPGLTDKENEALASYTRLLHHTDTATAQFLEALKGIDKSITVVFYGDHLPGLYPQSIFSEVPDVQYQTDYFIWNNKEQVKQDLPLIHSSNFPAAVLSQTHAKVSPYYALLTAILNSGTMDEVALSQIYPTVNEDLKLVQYDITLGHYYLKEYPDFFTLQP